MSEKYTIRNFTLFLSILFTFALLTAPLPTNAGNRLSLHSEDILLDSKTGKMWQVKRSRKLRSVEDVYAFLAQLNQGEYSDWRLPTKKEIGELFLLFDLKEQGGVKVRFEGSYYHMTESGDISVGSWELGDECGPSRVYYPERNGYVRAVRP